MGPTLLSLEYERSSGGQRGRDVALWPEGAAAEETRPASAGGGVSRAASRGACNVADRP